MVISIKANGSTYTVDMNHADGDIDEMITAYKGLLVQVGFHPQTVDRCFISPDGEWFTEDDHIKYPDTEMVGMTEVMNKLD